MARAESTDFIHEVSRARNVLAQAKSSVKHFYQAFDTVRDARKASGPPTVGEQDLVRAALVFAAAGLDSSAKELVKGSIRLLAEIDPTVQDGLLEFTRRQLRQEADDLVSTDASKFLAKILSSPAPYDELIDAYTVSLTGSSLQSVDELFKTANALNVKIEVILEEKKKLQETFIIRNKIIHELDVRFDVKQGQKKRNSRQKWDLEERSNLLLKVANDLIDAVEEKIQNGF